MVSLFILTLIFLVILNITVKFLDVFYYLSLYNQKRVKGLSRKLRIRCKSLNWIHVVTLEALYSRGHRKDVHPHHVTDVLSAMRQFFRPGIMIRICQVIKIEPAALIGLWGCNLGRFYLPRYHENRTCGLLINEMPYHWSNLGTNLVSLANYLNTQCCASHCSNDRTTKMNLVTG